MPTPEQVRQLPELVRVRVPKEWEDLNGHVNVKHHLTMYDLTSDPLLELLGISEDWVRTQRVGLFDLEHHIWFLNEVHVGEEVSLFLSFTARNDKRVQGHVFLLNVTHERARQRRRVRLGRRRSRRAGARCRCLRSLRAASTN